MDEKKKRKLYSDSNLAEALDQISKGMSIYQASKTYNIPESTLRDKRDKKYKNTKCGTQPILTLQEEKQIVDWIHYLGRIGFPVSKQQLLEVVSKLVKSLNRPNPFKDGVPGKGWFQQFMKRHPTVAKRVTQNLPTSRNQVTEEALRAWFDRVRAYLQNQDLVDIFEDPKRVFNCDETAFFLSPKESQVLVKRGCKRVYTRVANDDKECLTVLVNVSANGDIAPPMVLYPYKRMPPNIKFTVPLWWGLGNSDSGWMNMETFYKYVTNVFYPWVLRQKITLPVALFLDGHTSHISLPLSTFCKEKGIVLIALLPNATHILQPLDVAVFRSVKRAWRNIVRDFRALNDYTKLKRTDFALEVEKCFNVSLKVESIKNGFRCCGLYPFNPDNIDYTKLLSTKPKSADGTSTEDASSSERTSNDTNNRQFSQQFEDRLSPVTLWAFKDNEGDQWTGEPAYTKLYDFWRKHCFKGVPASDTTDLELGESTFTNNVDIENMTEPVLNFVVEHDGTLTRDMKAASSLSLTAQSSSTLVNTTNIGLSENTIIDNVCPNAGIDKKALKTPTTSLMAQVMRTSTPESAQCCSPLNSVSEIEYNENNDIAQLHEKQKRTTHEKNRWSPVAGSFISGTKTPLNQAATPSNTE
ncbi:uncharacterized protein LOC134658117 [Cydia amplana]|uniref:uncharacterized protein LOC134658117 n=1 Tax=Cydia amplana TaxID=1869771 RepID=UPI002FE63261